MRSVNLNLCWNSRVFIRALDGDGSTLWTQETHNDLTFAAGGVLMTALLRSGPSQVTHLYARFGDGGGNPGTLVPLDADLRNTNRSTFLDPTTSVNGGLWVPILAAPVQESSDSTVYNGNKGTFYFRIPFNIPASQIDPSGNFDIVTSYIYALGLAVATNTADRTQDVIITQLQDFSPFQIPPTGQMAIDYVVPFEVPLPA